MAARIEDYAMIGDMRTAALVGRDGSIDWLCFPRFDSAACFAALLGTSDNGRWLIAPVGEAKVKRSYRDGSLVLETVFTTKTGQVSLIDFMPVPIPGDECEHQIIRMVKVVLGQLPVRIECRPAFDYARAAHTARPDDCGIRFDGPDLCLVLTSPIPLKIEDGGAVGEIALGAGEERTFVLQVVPPGRKPGGSGLRARERNGCGTVAAASVPEHQDWTLTFPGYIQGGAEPYAHWCRTRSALRGKAEPWLTNTAPRTFRTPGG